jgi:hypothetical protein
MTDLYEKIRFSQIQSFDEIRRFLCLPKKRCELDLIIANALYHCQCPIETNQKLHHSSDADESKFAIQRVIEMKDIARPTHERSAHMYTDVFTKASKVR